MPLFHPDLFVVMLFGSARKNLQAVQNAAVRVLPRAKTIDHISPILTAHSWPPIQVRSDFKMVLMTYIIVNEIATHTRPASLNLIYIVKSPDKFSVLTDERTTSNKTCLVFIRMPFQKELEPGRQSATEN